MYPKELERGESDLDNLDITTPRGRVLRAAINLFAARGFDAVSVRDITTQAGVNLAAVNYYFESKEVLIRKAFRLAAHRMNSARFAALNEYEQSCENGKFELKPILELHARVGLEAALGDNEENRDCYRLFNQAMSMPNDIITRMFEAGQNDEIVLRFVYALAKALPDLSLREIFWRYYFFTGASFTATRDIAKGFHFRRLSGEQCNVADLKQVLENLVRFAVGGFSIAPVYDHVPEQFPELAGSRT
jgi:AcrR family transcriptional regulator